MSSEWIIDYANLIHVARKSDNAESFSVLERGECHRVGVGARINEHGIPLFFLEIYIRIAHEEIKVDLALINSLLNILTDIKKLDYSIRLVDDCVLCEKVSEQSLLQKDLAKLDLIVNKIRKN